MDTSITHKVGDKTIESIFPSNAMGHSAEYWAQQYNIAIWALSESDRLHREQIATLNIEIDKLKKA